MGMNELLKTVADANRITCLFVLEQDSYLGAD